MKLDFGEVLNFMGYLMVGLGYTIGASCIMGFFVFLLGLSGVNVLGEAGLPWVLPFYLLIISIYGLVINSVLYFFKLNVMHHKKLIFCLHALGFPIAAMIMIDFCERNLCYI